jgi:hypothetical protein
MKVKGKFRATLVRRFSKTKEVKMDLNKTFLYVTEFVNESDSPWPIYDHGHPLLTVPPGKSERAEQWHNKTDWSRWSKVVKTAKGEIILTESPAWSSPWPTLGYHEIELRNEAGASEESIRVTTPNPACAGASDYVTALRGIPRLCPLDLWDPLIKYSAIIWKRELVKVPVEGTSYQVEKSRVRKEYIPRKKAELKKILKERQLIEEEKLKKSHRKMMEEQEKLLGMAEDGTV